MHGPRNLIPNSYGGTRIAVVVAMRTCIVSVAAILVVVLTAACDDSPARDRVDAPAGDVTDAAADCNSWYEFCENGIVYNGTAFPWPPRSRRRIVHRS